MLIERVTRDTPHHINSTAGHRPPLTVRSTHQVKDFRQLYTKVVSDKHEDVMAKLGAILAKGIIDAGGRNVTVALQSRTGHNNMAAVVGMLVFTQYWFWYPLAHFLSLAFTPTCLVGLNADLRMPQMEVRSNARPSLYAYPPPIEERKREDREKVRRGMRQGKGEVVRCAEMR